MKRSTDRILTTHVGSLIRPPQLLEFATAQREGRPIDQQAFETCLRQAVDEVVRKQTEAGIDVISDGEFGKSSWAAYVLERLSGFELRKDQVIPLRWLGRDLERFHDFFEEESGGSMLRGAATEVCVAPITLTDHNSLARDIDNFKSALTHSQPQEAFITAVAPASTAYNGVNEYYPSDKEYVYAIADALREEYQTVYKSGLLLQVDYARPG